MVDFYSESIRLIHKPIVLVSRAYTLILSSLDLNYLNSVMKQFFVFRCRHVCRGWVEPKTLHQARPRWKSHEAEFPSIGQALEQRGTTERSRSPKHEL
jgi:hypothetical protein